jgi:transcription antitermination factor NusG
MGDWFMLQCSHGKTLELARSLNEAGFEACAPTETIVLHPRRGLKAQEVARPLIAGLVFAAARHLPELLALSHSPVLTFQVWDAERRRMVTRGHPYFRVFRPFGEVRTIPEAQLTPLRRIERHRRPKGEAPAFQTGAKVRFVEGGFEGLRGTVEGTAGGYVVVAIDDWAIPVQVSPWLLTVALDDPGTVHVEAQLTEQAQSAKAA